MRIPYVIGLAGGSGSGKTTFARRLQASLPSQSCAVLYQDSYYIDQSARFDRDGGAVNFDHPSSLDFPLLAHHLRELRGGRPVEVPVYDFATHTRRTQTQRLAPPPIILVDGILILHPSDVRELFDETVFFDTPEELRFARRLRRDVRERGRQPEGVRAQFEAQVKPMHDQFVEPTRLLARTVVSDLTQFDSALAEFCARLKARL